MTDLEAIDRELAELGEPPANLAELLERYGESDRSPERVDEVLASLSDGVVPAVAPPRPPPSLKDTVVEQPAAAPAPPADEVDADLDAFLADEDADERALSEPPAGAGDESLAATGDESEDDDDGFDEAPTGAVEMPAESELETYDGMVAPPAELQAGASEPPPGRPSSVKELLAQDLDPDDFPQTSHPPPPAPGTPEAEAVDAAAGASAGGDDDFELLVDDDDIIEIDDDELEMLEDD